jgi:hypothetical protein
VHTVNLRCSEMKVHAFADASAQRLTERPEGGAALREREGRLQTGQQRETRVCHQLKCGVAVVTFVAPPSEGTERRSSECIVVAAQPSKRGRTVVEYCDHIIAAFFLWIGSYWVAIAMLALYYQTK